MDDPSTHLKLSHVSKSFGYRKVVDDVNLEVCRSETFCVLGPSGCGKTTLLRMIAGLEIPESGSIEVGGRPAVLDGKLKIPPQDRGIGFVFQDLALWPHMTVWENLRFVLDARKVKQSDQKRQISDMLDLVRLSGFEKSSPESLSGGEQQRLAIARALVGGPSLLLLDEPLSSLDAHLKRHLQTELAQWLNRLRVTAVLITHDQSEAFVMADRLAIMSQGRILQVGTPQ